MSQDWDVYLCLVEDQPASILLDLGIAAEAPVADFPCLAFLRVTLRQPRPDGLSSSEEFEALQQIDDALEAEFEADRSALYVGRVTSGGTRDFYVYLGVPDGWDARAAILMAGFPDYEFESGTRDDPDWGAYFEFLHPSPLDNQRIWNRRVCQNLSDHGDALTSEREVDHWIYLPTEDLRDAFVERASQHGFRVRSTSEDESEEEEEEEDEPRYLAHLYRVDVPSFDNIDAITLPLFELAQELGGNYDGWETFLIKG